MATGDSNGPNNSGGNQSDGNGGAGGAGAGAGGGGAAEAWYTGADNETLGYLQNRGLDKQDAKAVAFASIKAHREAEKLLGAPQDQLLRLPKDGNDPAWRSVHHRLGVPQDAKEYDFKEVKFSSGEPLDANFDAFLRTEFHKNNVSAAAAQGITREFVSYIEKFQAEASAAEAATIATEKDSLVKNWGANFNANKVVAENAMRKLGIPEDAVEALANLKGVGHAKVLEMFRTIGEKTGEDVFVRAGGGSGSGPMTAEAAQSRVNDLKADKGWLTKFHDGDTAAKREFDNLMQIIASSKNYDN